MGVGDAAVTLPLLLLCHAIDLSDPSRLFARRLVSSACCVALVLILAGIRGRNNMTQIEVPAD
eukprot:gene2687-67018_t